MQFKIATVNAQSIRNKDILLTQEIASNNIDITLITKTWLNNTPQDTAWLHQSDLLQAGYAISTHKPTRGGGLALLYKQNMKIKKTKAQHLCMMEYAIWHVSLKNKSLNILGIYHPPPKQHLTNATFLDEPTELLTTRLPNLENPIILGDFNMHIEDTSNYNSKIFVNTMEALGLKQHITAPTHYQGNVLDLFFMETTSQMKVSQPIMLNFISDHRLIPATISVEKEIPNITRKKVRNYKNANPAMMMENFNPPNLNCNTDINEAQIQLNASLQDMIDKCVPEKMVKRPKKPQNAWFNDTLQQQCTIVKNRERAWKKYGKQHHWKAYTVERNKYNCQLHYFKWQSLSKRILDCKGNAKELFLLVNKLMGSIAQNPLPPNKTEEELAEDFARYFLSKIKKIRETFTNTPPYKTLSHNIPKFTSFHPLTEPEVHTVIMGMKNKHCKLDIIPTAILKQILEACLPAITQIVNLSLTNGEFCKSWKVTVVKPLLKKPGLDLISKNYRPISNLPFISKLVEKCMLKQFNEHCENYKLLLDFQSAYRKNYSTEPSLIRLTNDILWSMEKQHLTSLAILDLSAAFDTVDHDILLHILE